MMPTWHHLEYSRGQTNTFRGIGKQNFRQFCKVSLQYPLWLPDYTGLHLGDFPTCAVSTCFPHDGTHDILNF